MTNMSDNKTTVLTAAKELFGDKDITAVDRWVAADYRQHSSAAPDGPEGLRGLVGSLTDDVRHEVARVIADGDLVAVHGVYYGFGPDPLVAFDLYRVADGKLAEHWDALTPQVNETVSGRSQVDGPAEVSDLDKTEANRALVTGFVETVLKGGDFSVLTDFVSTEQYDQHHPEVADGLDGLAAAAASWAEQGKNIVYRTIHHTIAEGNFVLVVSEGEFAVPVAYWDLFRVADGKIVEHWDIVAPIPDTLPHDNGLF